LTFVALTQNSVAAKKPRKTKAQVKKNPVCPECKSANTVAIIYGLPTPQQQKAIDKGQAVRADREDWEGLTEWHCKACGCDWSGNWRRFKKPRSTE
jgi:hypothetical protein